MATKSKKRYLGHEEMMMDYASTHVREVIRNDSIDDELFDKLHVNRGLRDRNGKGVLTGLTNISAIISFEEKKGKRTPIDGQLWYRGYNVKDLVKQYGTDRYAYEILTYLLLFGELPTERQKDRFLEKMVENRKLPTHFVRDVVMKAPSHDIMNSMTRSVLTLASYDPYANSTEIDNVIRQCLYLISVFPLLAIYGYHAYNHYDNLESMYIHRPDDKKSIAENILLMLRPDKKFTKTEARVLGAALLLHMEHGGGNNSSFTTRVVTSTGSDTYATMAAAMASLKGPKHGGANIQVMNMMADIKKHVRDYYDKDEIKRYLEKIADGKANDHSGLIYGIGHAVYTLSDPRERMFRSFVERLSKEKDNEKELALYENVAELAPGVLNSRRSFLKPICPNVDFYSGFVYDMLGIPVELFTPMFAIARISGWCAHRIEELVSSGKLIRPAYTSVMEARELPE